MLDQSIESNQEIKEVFEDYGIYFRRFESHFEQGKSMIWTLVYGP